MRYKILCIFLFLTLSLEAIAQKYLLMDKIGSRHRVEYYPGDTLVFKLRGEDHFNTAVIRHLYDSLIIFDVGVVTLDDISALKIDHQRGGILGSYQIVRIAGIAIPLIDLFNVMVISGEPASLNRGVLMVGGSLVALSYLMQFSRKSRFKIKGNRRLRIIDLGFKE